MPDPFATDQTTAASVALSGVTAALICKVPPSTVIVVALSAPETTIAVTGSALALDNPTTLMPIAKTPVSTARAILLEPKNGMDERSWVFMGSSL